MWRDICKLGTVKEVENSLGELVSDIFYREDYIFCNEKSVTMTEFYQAATTDYKPSIVLEVKICDYDGQRFIFYEGKEYTIIRSYKTSSEDIEIVLEGGIKHGGT